MKSWGKVVTEKKRKESEAEHYHGIRIFKIVDFYKCAIYTFNIIILQEISTGSLELGRLSEAHTDKLRLTVFFSSASLCK